MYPLEGLKTGGDDITPPVNGPPWNPPMCPPRASAPVAMVPINKAATAKTVRLRFMAQQPVATPGASTSRGSFLWRSTQPASWLQQPLRNRRLAAMPRPATISTGLMVSGLVSEGQHQMLSVIDPLTALMTPTRRYGPLLQGMSETLGPSRNI